MDSTIGDKALAGAVLASLEKDQNVPTYERLRIYTGAIVSPFYKPTHTNTVGLAFDGVHEAAVGLKMAFRILAQTRELHISANSEVFSLISALW